MQGISRFRFIYQTPFYFESLEKFILVIAYFRINFSIEVYKEFQCNNDL